MTVQETRDEYKQMEGDPKVKSRIRQLRHDRSRSRMMAAVPDATVVITNPTHYAVALKYDRSMAGADLRCQGRRRRGAAHPGAGRGEQGADRSKARLWRGRCSPASISTTAIPSEHFKAVAEIIGFVMRLKTKEGWRPN